MKEKILFSIDELNLFRDNLKNMYDKASAGEGSALKYAKHSIKDSSVSDIKKVRVIVVGGSNMISASVENNNSELKIIDYKNTVLPSLTSKEILFELIISQIHSKTEYLAINFAYPMEPVFNKGYLDGKLTSGTKEHSFKGLINSVVGREIGNEYYKQTGKEIKVSLANDTVCLILSGLSKYKRANLAGGIIGTGFNFGFFEDSKTIINLESGNFNRFTQSESGKDIDKKSVNPGKQLWEKEVAGAYLYKHFNYYMDENKNINSTKELSEIATVESREGYLAKQLFKRSASLAAVQIASIFDFMNKDSLNMLIEGSLYWKGYNYKNYLQEYLTQLGVKKDITIDKIEDSSVIGAAELFL